MTLGDAVSARSVALFCHCGSSESLTRRLALDAHGHALAGARGKEVRASRPDLVSLPALGDSRLSCCGQDGALIGARRQLGELKKLAAHVSHDKPCRHVDWGERIRCRASSVVTVPHTARIATSPRSVHPV